MYKNRYILLQNFSRYCKSLHPIKKYRTTLAFSASDSISLNLRASDNSAKLEKLLYPWQPHK